MRDETRRATGGSQDGHQSTARSSATSSLASPSLGYKSTGRATTDAMNPSAEDRPVVAEQDTRRWQTGGRSRISEVPAPSARPTSTTYDSTGIATDSNDQDIYPPQPRIAEHVSAMQPVEATGSAMSTIDSTNRSSIEARSPDTEQHPITAQTAESAAEAPATSSVPSSLGPATTPNGPTMNGQPAAAATFVRSIPDRSMRLVSTIRDAARRYENLKWVVMGFAMLLCFMAGEWKGLALGRRQGQAALGCSSVGAGQSGLTKKDVLRAVEEALGIHHSVGGTHKPDLTTTLGKVEQDLQLNWRDISVVGFMKSEPKNRNAQRLASRLLWEFCETEDDSDLLITSGAAQALIYAMRTHQEDFILQKYGVSFIKRASFRSKTKGRELVALGALDSVVQAMKLNPTKDVVSAGCVTMNNLVASSEDVAVSALQTNGGIATMVRALESSLGVSPDSGLVERTCGRALRTIAELDGNHIRLFVNTGAIDVINSAAATRDDSMVVRSKDYLVSVRDEMLY